MMNNNKILTVSYGTFSCTLEGFDDSFGTMKAIAEYFRDLAADDRYFGAEPPQPDADMLARIAQKEVSRRVHAREQDGKIVLSALEDGKSETNKQAVLPAAAAPLAAEAPDVQDISTQTVEVTSEAEAEPAQGVVQVKNVEAPLEVETAPVTDDLDASAGEATNLIIEEEETPLAEAESTKEIKTTAQAKRSQDVIDTAVMDAVEEAAADLPDAPDLPDANATDEAAGDEVVQSVEGDHAVAAAADAAPVYDNDEDDIVPGQPDADVEAFFSDSTIDAFEDDEEATQAPATAPASRAADAAAEAPAPDSIAAKLQRIRAVVAQHEEADEDDDYLEDEHADAAESEPSSLIADARHDIEEALASDDAMHLEQEQEQEHEEDNADDVSAILSRLEKETATPDAVEAVAAAVSKTDTLADLEALDDAPIADVDADTPSVEDTVSNLFDDAEETLETDAPVAAPKVSLRKERAVQQPQAEEVASAKEPVKAEDTPVAKPAKLAPRARVIKVKRADLEAAIEQGDLEEYDDEDDDLTPHTAASADAPLGLDDLAPARSKTTTLSPEDEAELARELAALKEDIAAGDENDAEDAATAEETSTAKPSLRVKAAGRRALPSIDENNGSDVNRLLAETDHQMDEPESATRRDAFAHLRAAVAAKKADVAAGAPATDDTTDDEYRSDLAEVVRPRRPVSKSARTERPAGERPAPLKLVAEQRVDVDKPRAAGPVRPRRVSAVSEPAPQAADGESFTDFAAEMGATTLPQLLEAAAAYMSFVEGREQFSRPQLMTKVRQAGGDEGFSREEGLRSFGQLLRAGKIEKIKGGRFTVSDDIGYRPDERAAG